MESADDRKWTYRDTSDKPDQIVALIKDNDVSHPQPALTLSHLDVGVVSHVRVQLGSEKLHGLPSVIDKDLLLQIDTLVGVHHKTAKLRDRIEIRWVGKPSVVVRKSLEGNHAGRFKRVVVKGDRGETTILGIEVSKLGDHLVDHGLAESESVSSLSNLRM